MTSIRPLEPRDVDAWAAMMNEVIADGEAFVYDRPLSRADAEAYLKQYVAAFVAEVNGEVAGGYVLRPNQPGRGGHVCNATYLVSKAARGHRLGRTLGEHSLVEARALGFTAMQFNAVVATNAAAVRLWRSLGFGVIGTVPGGFRRGDGAFADLLVMHRML